MIPLGMIRLCATAVFVMTVGQAFSQSKLRSEKERCDHDLAQSRAAAQDSVVASKSYRNSRSKADFCAMTPASIRSIAAAKKAIKSCQHLYPGEMAKEQAAVEEFQQLIDSERIEYAYRCNNKAKASIIACTDTGTEVKRQSDEAVKAYASLNNQSPSSQTCADLKYLQTYIGANKAVLKACRGAPGEFSDVDVYKRMIAKVGDKISEFRAKYPGACRSR